MQATVVRPSATRQDEIPPSLIHDVDYTDLVRGDEDSQEAWLRIQKTKPELFWTPRNGGHWIATRADMIVELQSDSEHFSYRTLVTPYSPPPFPALNAMDGQEHANMRKVLMPELNKTALQHLEDEAREAARQILDVVAPKGRCEFISEVSNVMPIVVFLALMGLPLEDRTMLLPIAEETLRGATLEKRNAAFDQMGNYVRKWVDQRRGGTGMDLMSKVARAQVGDREISYEETLGMCVMLMLGGLDTVAGMLGFITRYLATHPEARQRLIDDPEIMQPAIEELIRRHGLANTCRYVINDMEFHGVQLKQGDIVQVPNCLFGLDEAMHDDPLTVNFDRPTPIRHAAFGNGVHICPGGILARREIKVFLQEWLKRIPNFRIVPGTRPKMVSGIVNSMLELHIEWDVEGAPAA